MWRTDHRALKFIFDAFKTTIPALQRYKLVADDYRFTTEWIPGTKMIADTMSRLCIIPAPRSTTMTTREMLTVDLSTLMPPKHTKEATQSPNGIKYFKICEEKEIAFYNMMNEEDILIEEEGDIEEEQEREEETEDDLQNPHDQPLHSEEDAIKGKLAVDIPTYTSNERLLLAAITYLRKYIIEPSGIEDRTTEELYGAVRKLAKSCILMDDKIMKMKVKEGIREISESLLQIKDIMKEAHDEGGHRGLEATMSVITARYWIPALEKVILRYITRCDTCQRFAKAHKLYAPNYMVKSYDIFKH